MTCLLLGERLQALDFFDDEELVFSRPGANFLSGFSVGGAMRSVHVLVISSVLAVSSLAQSPETVFRGKPVIKVTTDAVNAELVKVSLSEAPNLACVISEIGGKYYWASRENKPLDAVVSGAFLVFVAERGAGYIRIINPDMKEAARLMSDTEAQYDYVEHITLGLRSISYYGKSDTW